jgi:hypothetical protein
MFFSWHLDILGQWAEYVVLTMVCQIEMMESPVMKNKPKLFGYYEKRFRRLWINVPQNLEV